MQESRILQYEDFQWRIEQVATQHRAWSDKSAISLPALVPSADGSSVDLAAFVYGLFLEPDSSNPQVFPPHLIVRITPDGELIACNAISAQTYGQRLVGNRFAGAAADMTDEERSAFLETYYMLLTDEEGPLNIPWSSLNPESRKDLRELFWGMVEAPFIPFYKRHASEFMELVGTTPPG